MTSGVFDEAAPVTPEQWARAARHRSEMVAEIQRRRDWGAWLPSDRPAGAEVVSVDFGNQRDHSAAAFLYGAQGAGFIDLTERFAPKCEPEPPKLDREPESAFERQIAALLADKPSQRLEYAFWGCFLGLWAFIILALCMILSQ